MKPVIGVVATKGFFEKFDADGTSSIYCVPANHRLTRPICPSAARVPISDASRRRTVGLVGASGASRLMHRFPAQLPIARDSVENFLCHSGRPSACSRIARALARTVGSWTSGWEGNSLFSLWSWGERYFNCR